MRSFVKIFITGLVVLMIASMLVLMFTAPTVSANGVTIPYEFKHFNKYLDNPLTIPLHGANGVTHPDVLYFSGGMGGYKYWMVYTPYPPESYERPSIARSNDGISWTDSGITNPVVNTTYACDADPDFIHVSGLSKWFMVWCPEYPASLALAYSSDGVTWTKYNGVAINGNTNPVILRGTDTGGQAWECSGGGSTVAYPTLIYENGTFYLFYGSYANGANRGPVGYATFNWNNATDNIENFARYSSNPVLNLAADNDFKSGCGHIDISKYNSTYYMYGIRELVGSTNIELALFTSPDKIAWTNQGKVLARSVGWEAQHIYRSCPVVDNTGTMVLFSGRIWLYYSAFGGFGNSNIGIAKSVRENERDWMQTTWASGRTTPTVQVEAWDSSYDNYYTGENENVVTKMVPPAVYSTASDGIVYSDGTYGTYEETHDAEDADGTDNTSIVINVGQYGYEGGDYWMISRGALYFDTSSIPDSATITSATLSVCGINKLTVDNFDIVVQNGQPTYPHDPLVIGDYNYTNYSGNGGSLNTSGFVVGDYNDIVLNENVCENWINKVGTTKFILRSSRDISKTAPTNGNEYVILGSNELGVGGQPKLAVGWEGSSDIPIGGFVKLALTAPNKYYNNAYIESSIYDATYANWENVYWNENKPVGTSITVKLRSGNDDNPYDGGWSGWCQYANGAENDSLPNSRYVQYRVDLSTTDNTVTPELYDITITYENATVTNVAPNKPINLQPSARQTTTNVTISCIVTDNNNDNMTVFFYNASNNFIIDNDENVKNGAIASVVWSGLSRGENYSFFARSQDKVGLWGDNSDVQTFRVNSLPVAENLRTEGLVDPTGLTTFAPTFSWSDSDNDNDVQSNYRIQVGVSENDNSMWDNTGAALTRIKYSGKALSRSVTYYVRVRVKDNCEWSSWINGTFKLLQKVIVGNEITELNLMEAGDAPIISTSILTIKLNIKARVDNLLIYYASMDEPPPIPAAGIAPFYFDISTSSPNVISDATITFNVPKSWVVANDILLPTLAVYRNTNGTWQPLLTALVGENATCYYLEAATSGFSLFAVSGLSRVVTPPSESSDTQVQQTILVAALGIFLISVMLLVAYLKHTSGRH
jgi:PGF-pre-PGF domain-containing protein